MSNYGILIQKEPILSLGDTFKKARKTIFEMSNFDPPLTFKELRHIYDAVYYNGCIILRCTVTDQTIHDTDS